MIPLNRTNVCFAGKIPLVDDRDDDYTEVNGGEWTMYGTKMLSRQRIYVKVNSDFDSTGTMTPRSIIWSDGRTFKIDAVRDFRPASTMGASHSGDCFTVIIHGEEKYLFFERTDQQFGGRVGRWWIETTTG